MHFVLFIHSPSSPHQPCRFHVAIDVGWVKDIIHFFSFLISSLLFFIYNNNKNNNNIILKRDGNERRVPISKPSTGEYEYEKKVKKIII